MPSRLAEGRHRAALSCWPGAEVARGCVEAQIAIDMGGPMGGQLPIRAVRLIREWSSLHRAELYDNWERAQAHMPLARMRAAISAVRADYKEMIAAWRTT
ncbi:MAG: DUF4160 domain-containing protein [Solirubrobacteraceae bacterium]